MVTIAIISIMAGTVTIGFGSFIQTVRLQQTKGVITDTISNLTPEILRDEYQKQTVHFDEDYLVIEAEVENQSLSLKWNGEGACGTGKEELEIDNTGPSNHVHFAKKDKYENNIDIISIAPLISEIICVDFIDSEKTEWQYQLFRDSDVSQVIRLIHFNIRRNDADTVKITNGNNFTFEISAPYATEKFYDNGNQTTGTVALTIENEGGLEIITLQE